VNIAEVENELLDLARRFSLVEVVLDPWQMQSSLQRLHDRLPVKEFTFTAETVRRLSETLFDLMRTARLRLYPDDELERELLSLNVVQKGYGWRIDHRSGGYSGPGSRAGYDGVRSVEDRSKRIDDMGVRSTPNNAGRGIQIHS
jgi:hypothetical protein